MTAVADATGEDGSTGGAPLRVVSWNLRAAIGPGEPFPPAWWRHVRPDRLERIAAVIVAVTSARAG